MPIFKAKLSITVLLEEPDEPTARALLSNLSLMGVVYEIDDGEIAGSLSVASVEPVPPECVEAELLAVNAVPNFFSYPERAMAAEITDIPARIDREIPQLEANADALLKRISQPPKL